LRWSVERKEIDEPTLRAPGRAHAREDPPGSAGCGIVGLARVRLREIDDESARAAKPRIHLEEAEEAPREETGADEENESQRHLGYHEPASEPSTTSRRAMVSERRRRRASSIGGRS
jgi:hypothetical protein